MRSLLGLLAPLASFAFFAACTTTVIHETAPPADGGAVDTDAGDVPVVVDAGAVDSGAKKDAGAVAPANPQPIPPVTYNGQLVLGNISLVTVTFDSDTLRTTVEAFDDAIGTTTWWDQARAGYCDGNKTCVGPATNGGHVHLATATLQGSYTDSSKGAASTLQAMIATNITNSIFPAPTPDTLYMIYLPSGTTVSLDTEVSCQKFGGYHNAMTAQGVKFAYAVMPRCATGSPQGDLDSLTTAASHELAEAATDPYISTDPLNPYTGFGSSTDAWDVPAGGEVGDRCFDPFYQGNDAYQQGTYRVARIFNNVAAKAGHDPCVPVPTPATYFNVAPLGTGDVVQLAVGATTTLKVQAISDGPLAPLAFQAAEVTQMLGKGQNVLSLSSSASSLAIGGSATVTIKLNATPSQGYALFMLESQASTGKVHYWPVVVQP